MSWSCWTISAETHSHKHFVDLGTVNVQGWSILKVCGMQGVSSSFKLGRFYVARHKAITVKGWQRRCNLGKLLLWEYGCGYFPVLLCWNIRTLPVRSATNDSIITCLIGIWRDRRICFPSSLTCVQSGWLNCCGYSVLCVRRAFWMRWKAVWFQKNETGGSIYLSICLSLARHTSQAIVEVASSVDRCC
jgi:hypothetical protein